MRKPITFERSNPRAGHWQSFSWGGGTFDSASRAWTAAVEGTIRIPHHLVLVTLSGGARSLEVGTACGHRYRGQDRPGAVSFVPASCERWIKMLGVKAKWASISLRADLLRNPGFHECSGCIHRRSAHGD